MKFPTKTLALSALFAAISTGSYIYFRAWEENRAAVAARQQQSIAIEQEYQRYSRIARAYSQCLREFLSPAGLKAFLIHEYGYVGFTWKDNKIRHDQRKIDAVRYNTPALVLFDGEPDDFIRMIPKTDIYDGQPSMALANVRLGKQLLTWPELGTLEAECEKHPKLLALKELSIEPNGSRYRDLNYSRQQVASNVFRELDDWPHHAAAVKKIELENQKLIANLLSERNARMSRESDVSRNRDLWIIKK